MNAPEISSNPTVSSTKSATSGVPAATPPRNTLRWVGIALGVMVLIIACIALGQWQWNRHENRDAVITSINNNYNSVPVPLGEVLPTIDTPLKPEQAWTPVTVTGHYVQDGTALLRNRPIKSTPSVHVLVPFETTDGNVMLVNRGWVPYRNNANRPDLPAPPSGEVTLTVHLRQDEPKTERDAPVGQVQAINIGQSLAAGAEYGSLDPHWAQGRTYQAYGSLASEDPAPSVGISPLPKPDIDPRSHLSYAFQWWVFAVGALGGFFVLYFRERSLKRAAREGVNVNPFLALNELAESGQGTDLAPEVTASARPTKQGRKARARLEEDYEDSLFE